MQEHLNRKKTLVQIKNYNMYFFEGGQTVRPFQFTTEILKIAILLYQDIIGLL